jgi:hypothetical protein
LLFIESSCAQTIKGRNKKRPKIRSSTQSSEYHLAEAAVIEDRLINIDTIESRDFKVANNLDHQFNAVGNESHAAS